MLITQFLQYIFPNGKVALAEVKDDKTGEILLERVVFGRNSFVKVRLVPNNSDQLTTSVQVHDVTIHCDTDGNCHLTRHTFYQRQRDKPEEVVPFTEYYLTQMTIDCP